MRNLDNSVAIHTPGQSGHAFYNHYNEMVELGAKLNTTRCCGNQRMLKPILLPH
ncbi:hypothetical protein [Nostoc sp. DedQUE09]|uniref:hypothetical protein n=1 Tax=Nostoc sp. DedQUE09 TaxID=3075394 RepID=UPI003A0FE0BB